MNLTHHKDDFGMEVSWTFCASGHGDGLSDGIGATVKSSANRSILTSGTTLSSVEDFFNFTKKMNEETAKSKGASEPAINAYYLNSTTIDNTTKTLLSNRFRQLDGKKYSFCILSRKIFFLGGIKDIRQFHQFDPKDQSTIFCRRAPNSLIVEEFTLRTNTTDEQNRSLREIQTVKDVSINQIVIFQHGDKQHLAEVIDIRESQKEVMAQCYEPPISLSSYIRCFNKVKNDTTIPCKNIIGSFIYPPVFGRRHQLLLSKEQFIDIQKFCT